MPTNTPNHGYQMFEPGETEWTHAPDFESLDTDVEIRDAESNRTNYDAEQGALFRATDTGAIYIGNGSSWTLADIEVDSLNGGGPIVDGDGVERNMWVIPAGGSDPSGAAPEDLIFEEES